MDSFAPLRRPRPALSSRSFLGVVVDVDDPDRLGRVKVRLHNFTGTEPQQSEMWARVVVPFAGDGYGAFTLPDVDEEVLVQFVNDDTRSAVVVGALYSGGTALPEPAPSSRIDRWTLTGKAGTRIAIEEPDGGSATITFSTPGNVTGTLTDDGGGRVRLEVGGTSITADTQGVEIKSSGQVKVEASRVTVTSPTVTVDAGVSTFNGLVRCDTLQTTTCIATTYTPGAGNIW